MSVERNIKLDRSSRRVLLAALGVIAVFGLYRWILWPYSSQLYAAQQHEAALDDNIQKADFLDMTLKKKKAELEKMSKQAEQLRNELFTVGEARKFFASLATIGSQTGGRVLLFLSTDDIWRNYKAMQSAGIKIIRQPKDEPFDILAVFEYLYGNLWDLIERNQEQS